jgi:chromosomal replication initiator protein
MIQKLVGERFGVSLLDMTGRNQERFILDARQVGMWLARRQSYSLPTIGRAFRRDHTTVRYACLKIEARMADDPYNAVLMAQLVEDLEQAARAPS